MWVFIVRVRLIIIIYIYIYYYDRVAFGHCVVVQRIVTQTRCIQAIYWSIKESDSEK